MSHQQAAQFRIWSAFASVGLLSSFRFIALKPEALTQLERCSSEDSTATSSKTGVLRVPTGESDRLEARWVSRDYGRY
jgi:hypothetical protein